MERKILILSTGGTIASAKSDTGRAASGALTGEALVSTLPLPPGLSVEIHSVLQKPSNALTPEDVLALRAHCLSHAQQRDLAGIVITHGTDTLEDTAAFLQSTLPHELCPVVITGSQRVPHALGSDAMTNLLTAIRIAAAPASRGCGVLVAFNETIYSANHIRKISSFQVNGFEAPGYGRLGYVDGDRVRILQTPVLPSTLTPGNTLPRVDLHSVALGCDPSLLDASRTSGARGIVIDALGRGHVPPDWIPAITRALGEKIPVVIATSCLHGPLGAVYEFKGSLFEMTSAGALPVYDLSARKARMRLMAWLSNPGQSALAELFSVR